MDPRTTPYNGRVAHTSLKGKVAAKHFDDGKLAYVCHPVTDICDKPSGQRIRQLLFGASFLCLDYDDGWIFGFAEADGYVGWVSPAHLLGKDAPTHHVVSGLTYAKERQGLKDGGAIVPLSLGSRLTVVSEDQDWAEVIWSRSSSTTTKWVPIRHLEPLGKREADPAEVASRLDGAPYLWGGNSALGIDCSGLVQVALLACGIPCPGDSDLQREAFPAISSTELSRGDLVFWSGHVGMMLDREKLIHANAHHMSTKVEPLAAVAARIAEGGDGEIRGFARPT